MLAQPPPPAALILYRVPWGGQGMHSRSELVASISVADYQPSEVSAHLVLDHAVPSFLNSKMEDLTEVSWLSVHRDHWHRQRK